MGLSKEQIEKHSDNLAKDINKTMQDHYDRARKNEVTREDANRIISDGWSKSGVSKKFDEYEKAAPEKPRDE